MNRNSQSTRRIKSGGYRQRGRLAKALITGFVLAFILMTTLPAAHAVPDITGHGALSDTVLESHLQAGEIFFTANTLNWTSDVDWLVSVTSLDADMGQSDDMSYTKPLSDLGWKLAASGSYTTMTTTEATVTTGAIGSGNFDVDYRVALDWVNDKPGDYGVTVRYTITSN